MKTYYRDIRSFDEALRFAEHRSSLGHNVRDERLETGYRIYFSAGPLDIARAEPMVIEKT